MCIRDRNVSANSCRVEKGTVIHTATSRRASYGSLVETASKLSVPADIPLKEPKDFTLIGKPTRRLDTPPKTNGTAQFGLDVVVPGMKTALIARSPVFGGKLVSFDATETLQVPGVKAALQIPSGVAIIADRFWPAKLGRDKLKAKWDDGENANLSTAKMLSDFSAQSASPGSLAKKVGDPQSALASAHKKITAEYLSLIHI